MIPTLLQVMSMEEPFVSVTRGQGRTGGKNRCVHQQSQVSHCRERDRHLRLTSGHLLFFLYTAAGTFCLVPSTHSHA